MKQKDYPAKFWAGGFLYNPKTKQIFLHLRDGNTKFNPNSWAFFGGLNEGDETPKECFKRELFEEIGLDVPLEKIIPLCDYLNTEFDTYRYVFFVESDIDKSSLTLGEGADFNWLPIEDIDKVKMTDKTAKDLKIFIKKLGL